MPISALKTLRGQIEEIQLGDVMAHVVVRVGGTRSGAAEEPHEEQC
jgi:molybdopterin-binding protein